IANGTAARICRRAPLGRGIDREFATDAMRLSSYAWAPRLMNYVCARESSEAQRCGTLSLQFTEVWRGGQWSERAGVARCRGDNRAEMDRFGGRNGREDEIARPC